MAIKLSANGTSSSPDPSTSMTSESTQQRWDQLKLQAETPLPPLSPSSALASPPTTLLPANEMKTYGSTPTLPNNSGQELIHCEDCGRPMFESAREAHALVCKAAKERRDNPNGVKKRRLSDASDTSPNKKPKPTSLVVVLGDKSGTGTDSDSTKKKKKDKERDKEKEKSVPLSTATTVGSTSNSAGKPKPKSTIKIDVDRQCGVITDKGLPCQRSLTCKTHSMGAKRSVPHRTQPYDILLHEHQKATKPETFLSKKPVQPRVGPGSEAWEGGKKRKKGDGEPGKKGRKKEKAGNLIVGEWEESDAGEGEEALIDSEDEVESVLKGLEKAAHGRPISVFGGGGGYTIKSMFVQRNMKLGRLREVLGGVFGKAGTSIGQ